MLAKHFLAGGFICCHSEADKSMKKSVNLGISQPELNPDEATCNLSTLGELLMDIDSLAEKKKNVGFYSTAPFQVVVQRRL